MNNFCKIMASVLFVSGSLSAMNPTPPVKAKEAFYGRNIATTVGGIAAYKAAENLPIQNETAKFTARVGAGALGAAGSHYGYKACKEYAPAVLRGIGSGVSSLWQAVPKKETADFLKMSRLSMGFAFAAYALPDVMNLPIAWPIVDRIYTNKLVKAVKKNKTFQALTDNRVANIVLTRNGKTVIAYLVGAAVNNKLAPAGNSSRY